MLNKNRNVYKIEINQKYDIQLERYGNVRFKVLISQIVMFETEICIMYRKISKYFEVSC